MPARRTATAYSLDCTVVLVFLPHRATLFRGTVQKSGVADDCSGIGMLERAIARYVAVAPGRDCHFIVCTRTIDPFVGSGSAADI